MFTNALEPGIPGRSQLRRALWTCPSAADARDPDGAGPIRFTGSFDEAELMKKLLITSTAAVMLSMATGVFAAETSKSATAVNGSATEAVPGKTTVKGGADGGTDVPFKTEKPNKVDARNQNNMQ